MFVNANNAPNIVTLVEEPLGAASKYKITGYNKFLDQEGYPAIAPPWGELCAVDLNNGTIAWRVPLGEHPELIARGVPQTGTDSFGEMLARSQAPLTLYNSVDSKADPSLSYTSF